MIDQDYKKALLWASMELLGITYNKTANVALIQNARSYKGRLRPRDIIKVEGMPPG